MHAALDDPATWKVVCMKSAQVAWTDGVINNWIGRCIDVDPSPIIVMFPKAEAAKEYASEKFDPMVRATPRIRRKVSQTKKRSDNRQLFKRFVGDGFLKLVGSNSISNVKSTPAPRVVVEEPDDCNVALAGQGDSIKLLEERTKSYDDRKVVFGGTPSIKGASRIESDYEGSDQRKLFVPCHHCNESHVLAWENMRWDSDEGASHAVYGSARPETAFYCCPHCGGAWDDADKTRNVANAEWRATAEFRGIAGFYVNEIYSSFPGSKFARLVERYLEAQHKAACGDNGDLIVFTNSALGLPYELASDAPDIGDLDARSLEYAELSVPQGGLIVTAGVDVQHDRLAVVIRAWGRGAESWLLFWGEIAGTVNDANDDCWKVLDQLLFGAFTHESGAQLRLSACTIDSSDGNTSDVVYGWVRTRQHRGVMAGKGDSHDNGIRNVFTRPQKADSKGRYNSKADKYGLQVYRIGTHQAKDLIASRLKLLGNGPGRMHWYQNVRPDYFEQITAEIPVPSRTKPGRKVWMKKTGVRNEGLDCEVMALHAAHAAHVHAMKPHEWDAIEKRVLQVDLFAAGQADDERAESPQASAREFARRHRRKSNFATGHRR